MMAQTAKSIRRSQSRAVTPFTTALVSADLIWMRDTIKIMRSRG